MVWSYSTSNRLKPGAEEIASKLSQAEARRKAMEAEKLEKLKLSEKRAEFVRKRKSLSQISESDLPTIEGSTGAVAAM
ncbi:hypothetical protein HDU93_005800 [Gonapodya sp. JEL0774]|nr:hypothetical protein HDU93_005800 [Gonapodya sp. JEL0774]